MDYEVDFGRSGTWFRRRLLFGKGEISIGETMVVARGYKFEFWEGTLAFFAWIVISILASVLLVIYLNDERISRGIILSNQIIPVLIFVYFSTMAGAGIENIYPSEITFVRRDGRDVTIYLLYSGANLARGYTLQMDSVENAKRAAEELAAKIGSQGPAERRKACV